MTFSRSSIAAALLLAAVASTASAQRGSVTLVTGTLKGVEGTPMRLAHVHLSRPGTARAVASAPVASDGRFAIATTDTGLFYIEFTGVDHYSAGALVFVGPPATIAMDVRLKHYAYTDTLDRVTAIGDWNHFDFGTSRPLVHQPDGRYTLDIDSAADTLAYQLLHLEASGGRSINGTQADYYAYDNGGDYRSVVRTQHGRATIVFDPRALARPAGERSITLRDTTSRAARIYALFRSWSEQRRAYFDSSRAVRARHDSLHYDWTASVVRRTALLRRERDPVARQLLMLEILDAANFGGTVDTGLAHRIVGELPPSSPWWAWQEFGGPWMMSRALNLAAGRRDPRAPPDTNITRAALAYFDRMVAEHPDSNVRADALQSAIFLSRGLGGATGAQRSNEYYTRLVTDYPNYPALAFVKAQLSPNRVMRVGADFPAFRFPSLDDSAVVLTKESMAGKTVLVEFWATWCGPCIGEMPQLHAAHDSLASRGVEFLSVSLDEKADDVRRFRAGQWHMPWRHAFVGGGFTNPQMREMEIMFLPRAVLVGRDGKILAVDGDLRGDSLLPTIRRAMQESAQVP